MNIKIHDMKKENYFDKGKAVLFLMLATLLGSCTDNMDEGIGKPLPEGKYPVEFTSATYGLEVDTRAVTENSTWTGNELVAVKFGTEGVKQYTAASGGSITATTPFYWKNTQSQTVTAWHKPSDYTSTMPTTFTVQSDQNSVTGYAHSDLIMDCRTISFASNPKELTFKHLPAKVTITLTGNDVVPDLTGAVVTLMNVNLTSGAINAATSGITVAQANEGTSTITPKRGTLSADKKTLTVQALLPPQNVSGSKFVQITVGGNTYTYTPKTGDGLFETGKEYPYKITLVGKDKLIVTIPESNEWTDEGNVDITTTEVKIFKADDLKPGDYYYSDGTWSDGGLRKLYADGTYMADNVQPVLNPTTGTRSVIGIVLKVGKDASGDWKDDCSYKTKGGTTAMPTVQGYVLALYDANDGNICKWGSYSTSVSTSTDIFTGFYGYKDTQKIIGMSNYGSKTFPAAYHATNGYETGHTAPDNSSGWFLPSGGQCKYWRTNKNLLLEQVRKASGNSSYSWKSKYLSSTENATSPSENVWTMATDIGQGSYISKLEMTFVRPCLAF